LDLPSIICLAVLTIGLFRPIRFLLAASWALAALGSLALVPTELTGGTSLVAGTVGTLFVVLKVLSLPGGLPGMIEGSFNFRRLGLLAIFTLVAVIGAIILPVAFKGTVDVFPMRSMRFFLTPEPLAPTAANFTQSAYLVISFLVAASYSWLARRPRFVDDFGWAVVIGAIAIGVTGLADIVTKRLGIADALSVFRTASYAFATEAEVQGFQRTIGLMPEASAFGSHAAFHFSLLLFTRDMYAPSIRARVVLPLIAACGALAVLSTSSTAYVALGVTIALFLLDCVRGLLFGAAIDRSRKLRELAFVVVTLIVLFLAAMFFDQTRDSLHSVFDEMILQKTQSASYIQRSSWTQTALEAWLATGGFGVGVGSVRTSNFFANTLASTGFLGFGLFVVFLVRVFTSAAPQADRRLSELVKGSKLTLFPAFVGAALAGTTPDYGGAIAALFGIIVGASALNYSRLRTASRPLSSSQERAPLLR
jgi:hypothetical protein